MTMDARNPTKFALMAIVIIYVRFLVFVRVSRPRIARKMRFVILEVIVLDKQHVIDLVIVMME